MSLEKRIELLHDAEDKSYELKVDKLECDVSVRRQSTDLTFQDIMKRFRKDSHFVVIYRRGSTEYEEGESWNKWKLEVGFSTSCPDKCYFLFIDIDKKELPYFIEKYELKPLGD